MTNELLSVVVVDDEAIARERMARLIGENGTANCVRQCVNARELFACLSDIDVDLVFLDIQMPGQTGLEIAELLEAGRPHIVFTTAHAHHAVDAFRVGAIDYLLKPITLEAIGGALDRVRSRLTPVDRNKPPESVLSDRLPVSTSKGIRLIRVEQISHIVLDGALAQIVCDSEILLSDTPLAELETRLPAGWFERVHRRALVNLGKVSRLEPLPTGGYIAWMETGAAVDVSRQAARALRRRLGLR